MYHPPRYTSTVFYLILLVNYVMQIRKRGSNFQLLRRKKDKESGSYKHKTIGAFPVLCRSIDEVDEELRSQLTKREHLQLEEYLERRQQKLDDSLKKRELARAPNAIEAIGKAIRENFRDNYDADDVLAAYQKLTKALCEHGYGPEIVEITIEAAAREIPGFELEEDLASRVMSAWEKLRKSLEVHGYTLKWFSLYKKASK
jgi:hypothetical protein